MEVVTSRAEQENKNTMKRILFLIISALFVICGNADNNIPRIDYLPFKSGESIQYDVYYHWGIIWKKAAQGTLLINDSRYNDKNALKSSLACRTLAFADKILKVRDTLNSITTTNIKPLYYEKIANEGNYRATDILKYIYIQNSDSVGGDITLIRKKRDPSNDTVWTTGTPYDMLSVFYFLRTVEYRALDLNSSFDIPIFTGRKVITMRVTYIGRTIVELKNKSFHESYRINLNFLNDDNLKDEDPPIDVWLSSDNRRIPLKVEGKLPIGSLQAEYAGN